MGVDKGNLTLTLTLTLIEWEVRPFGVTKGEALSFIFREMGLSKEEDGEERREGEGEEMTPSSDQACGCRMRVPELCWFVPCVPRQ